MKRKKYISPMTLILNVNIQHALLAGSDVSISNTVYDSETNGIIRSRESGSFWDDEEE